LFRNISANIISIVVQYYVTGGWGGLVLVSGRKPEGKDKTYLKRITAVEEKKVDYTEAEADIGDDVGADITEQGAVRKAPSGIKMIRRYSGKSKRQKRK